MAEVEKDPRFNSRCWEQDTAVIYDEADIRYAHLPVDMTFTLFSSWTAFGLFSSYTAYITFPVSFLQTACSALFDYRSIYSYISRLISLVLSPVPIHHSLSILYRYYSHCLIASLYVSSLEIASRGLRRTPLLLLLLLLGVVIAPPPRRPFPSATRLRFLDRSVRQPRLSDHTFVLQQWCINLHLRVYCLLGSPPPSAKPQP